MPSANNPDGAVHVKALQEAGCEHIFKDEVPEGRWDRPELKRLMTELRQDDVILVPKVDHLTRSVKEFTYLFDKIKSRGAHLKTLSGPLDTTAPDAGMLIDILMAFAGYERVMLAERVKVGFEKAREKGHLMGRRSKFTNEQKRQIIHIVLSGAMTAAELARNYEVHPSTICRLLAQVRMDPDAFK